MTTVPLRVAWHAQGPASSASLPPSVSYRRAAVRVVPSSASCPRPRRCAAASTSHRRPRSAAVQPIRRPRATVRGVPPTASIRHPRRRRRSPQAATALCDVHARRPEASRMRPSRSAIRVAKSRESGRLDTRGYDREPREVARGNISLRNYRSVQPGERGSGGRLLGQRAGGGATTPLLRKSSWKKWRIRLLSKPCLKLLQVLAVIFRRVHRSGRDRLAKLGGKVASGCFLLESRDGSLTLGNLLPQFQVLHRWCSIGLGGYRLLPGRLG